MTEQAKVNYLMDLHVAITEILLVINHVLEITIWYSFKVTSQAFDANSLATRKLTT